MVRFNTIFKNTSVLLVEKICDLLQVTGRWPTLSHSVVSSTPLIIGNDSIFSTINFFKNVQFFLSILLRKENCIWSSHFAIVLLLIQKMYFS
jgi:hypothetical protein